MDLENLIKNWDFETAKAFYLEFGNNKILRSMLGTKNTYVENRLKKELKKIVESDNFQSFEIKEQKTGLKLRSKLNSKQYSELEKITFSWKRKYKKASRIQMSLHHDDDDDVRKMKAFEILNLMDEVYQDWDQIQYYEQYGCFLPTKNDEDIPLKSLEKADLMQRMRNLRTYLSPSKKKIYNESQRKKYGRELEKIEKLLIEIDTD